MVVLVAVTLMALPEVAVIAVESSTMALDIVILVQSVQLPLNVKTSPGSALMSPPLKFAVHVTPEIV
jgi:hypothetical protein